MGGEAGLGLNPSVAEPDLSVCTFGQAFIVGHQCNGQAVPVPEVKEEVVQGFSIGGIQVA